MWIISNSLITNNKYICVTIGTTELLTRETVTDKICETDEKSANKSTAKFNFNFNLNLI